jgi:hypothetical protein
MEGGGPAFYLCDIYDWVRDPKGYRRFEEEQSTRSFGDQDGCQHLE